MIGIEEQLDFIRSMQEWRGPVVDAFFRILNFFDTGEYFSALNAFVWIGLSWRWGARLGYLFIINGIVNSLLKDAFGWPRPFFLDPLLGIVSAKGYGFPSGAAQSSMLLAGLLIYVWKSPWAWPTAISYLLLISFSRIFLGVHFPVDLLGGWFFGLLLLVAFLYGHRPIEKFSKAKPGSALFLALVFFLLLSFILPSKNYYLLNVGIIISIGIAISTKYDLYISSRRKWHQRMFHGLIAVGGSFLLGFGAAHLLHFEANQILIVYTVVGSIWISLLASPFCKRATVLYYRS